MFRTLYSNLLLFLRQMLKIDIKIDLEMKKNKTIVIFCILECNKNIMCLQLKVNDRKTIK